MKFASSITLLIVCLGTLSVALNPPEWRYLSGAKVRDSYGVGGAPGQFSQAYTPGSRRDHACYVDDNNVLYSFGGKGELIATSGFHLGDLWCHRHFAGWESTGEWAYLGGESALGAPVGEFAGPTPRPGGREESCLWAHGSSVFIFGGVGKGFDTTVGYLNDLWSFNVSSLRWAWLKGSSAIADPGSYGSKGASASGNSHPMSSGHFLMARKATGTVIIWGGAQTTPGSNSDLMVSTWSYNPSLNQWTWISGVSDVNQFNSGGVSEVFNTGYYPGGRHSSAVMDTYRKGSNLVYVFGGWGRTSIAAGGAGALADLWAYDINTNKWAYIAGETAQRDSDASGSYGAFGIFNTAYHPGARYYGAGFADPNSNYLYVYGGYGFDSTILGDLNDFWCFDPTTKLWAFVGGDTVINQFSIYSGGDWYSSNNKPGSNRLFGSGVSISHGLMYLFGGQGYDTTANSELNDLWVTKGPTVSISVSPTVTSSPTTTPTIPPTPTPSPMQIVTWNWISGTTKNNLKSIAGAAGEFSTAYYPGTRRGCGMAFNKDNDLAYIYGGKGYNTVSGAYFVSDMWAFRHVSGWSTKAEWAFIAGNSAGSTILSVYTQPSPSLGLKYEFPMWYHDNLLYIFGGTDNNQDAKNDLWTFNITSNAWTWKSGASGKNPVYVLGERNVPSSSNMPQGFDRGMLVVLKSDGNVTLWGGMNDIHLYSTMWEYCSSSNIWTWINGPTNTNPLSVGGSSGVFSSAYYPGGRRGVSMFDTYNQGKDIVYAYSGWGRSASASGQLWDLWGYNVRTNMWAFISGDSTQVNTAMTASFGILGYFDGFGLNRPPSRTYSASYADPNSDLWFISGGYGYGATTAIGNQNDFWAYNVTTGLWAWDGGSSVINQLGTYDDLRYFSPDNQPGSSYDNGYCVNTNSGLIVKFGGYGRSYEVADGYLHDLWVSKGSTIPLMITATPTATAPSSPTPTSTPTWDPSVSTPTAVPTASTTTSPTVSPTTSATTSPTVSPTSSPTATPTMSPTTSPTVSPTSSPTAIGPTSSATTSPTVSSTSSPTTSPTSSPTAIGPTSSPTTSPTVSPTTSVTTSPTASPTLSPTTSPTSSPTAIDPTSSPTTSPTISPTTSPTVSPTTSPTTSPSAIGPTATATSTPTGIGSGGSTGGSGSGLDEVIMYIIIGVGALLAGMVMILAVMASTRKGRDGIRAWLGKRSRKRHEVIQVGRKAASVQQAQQPIIVVQNYSNYNVIAADSQTPDSTVGKLVVAQHAQKADDPSQLTVNQGDILRIEQDGGNGWVYVSLMNESRDVAGSGWYPATWISLMDNPYAEDLEIVEDEGVSCH